MQLKRINTFSVRTPILLAIFFWIFGDNRNKKLSCIVTVYVIGRSLQF